MPVKFLLLADESQGVKSSVHACPVQKPGLTPEVSEWESQCLPRAGVGRMLSGIPEMGISQGDLGAKGRMWLTGWVLEELESQLRDSAQGWSFIPEMSRGRTMLSSNSSFTGPRASLRSPAFCTRQQGVSLLASQGSCP